MGITVEKNTRQIRMPQTPKMKRENSSLVILPMSFGALKLAMNAYPFGNLLERRAAAASLLTKLTKYILKNNF